MSVDDRRESWPWVALKQATAELNVPHGKQNRYYREEQIEGTRQKSQWIVTQGLLSHLQ